MESGFPGRPGVAESPDPATTERAADLAGALHEVSNALTVILGWVERARNGERIPEALDLVAGRARLARNLVRRAIGAAVPSDPPREVDALVADAVLGLEPVARRGDVELALSVAPEVADVTVGGPGAVLQILTNLLLNAISASPRRSVVRVEVSGDPESGAGIGRLRFCVCDEGPGIEPARRATLLSAGVSTRPGGAGLGLVHASTLAKSWGGELALVPSARGARFELSWPVRAEEPAPTSVRVAAPVSALAGARILVVEDDRSVVDLLDTALGARGADVVAVRSHSELLEALGTGLFDAALFDLSPIQDDVSGALFAVRQACPAAKLVVMSGSAAAVPELPASCTAAWVRKPFEIDEIVRAITA